MMWCPGAERAGAGDCPEEGAQRGQKSGGADQYETMKANIDLVNLRFRHDLRHQLDKLQSRRPESDFHLRKQSISTTAM